MFYKAGYRFRNKSPRHFIKISFINEGTDFIDLPSIIQDKSVASSIPDYFQNSKLPMICYNKPIKSIFNFNKIFNSVWVAG